MLITLLRPGAAQSENFVVAGVAAGQTIIEAVLTKADAGLGLAEAAVSLTIAAVFGHLALHAAVFIFGGARRGHEETLAPDGRRGKCPW